MKKRIGVICVIIIILGFFLFQRYQLSLYLFTWGISIDLNSFQYQSLTNKSQETLNQAIIEARNDSSYIRIIKTVSENSSKYIADKKYLLHSLFEPTTSPYPEVISNTIECPEEFKPKIVKTEFGEIYYLYAGERYNFGVCTKDLIAFSAAYGIFDCKDKGIFEVQIFAKSQQEIEQIIQTFQCNL